MWWRWYQENISSDTRIITAQIQQPKPVQSDYVLCVFYIDHIYSDFSTHPSPVESSGKVISSPKG